jgi:hypothetical protein
LAYTEDAWREASSKEDGMSNTAGGDDQAEREDIQTLQAERSALQSRVAAIGATPWNSVSQMKSYIDELEGLIRHYNDAYGMKAFLWAARGRPTCRNLLNDLVASANANRDSYTLSYNARIAAAGTTSFPPPPPPPGWPDEGERIRRSMLNLCLPNGHQLPNYRVNVCPVCGLYPYL